MQPKGTQQAGAGATGWILPPPEPSQLVAVFWRLRGGGAAPARFLPSGCCDLVLNLGASFEEIGGPIRVPSGSFLAVGPYDGPAQFRARGPIDLFGIRLAGGQAERLLGGAVAGLARAARPAEGLGRLLRGLRAARDDAERMRIAQDSLDGGVAPPADEVALAFVERIGRREPAPLAEIRAALDLSERQLQRRVLRAVGLSPKRYARVARFNRALAMLRDEPAARLAEVAAASSYADQAHLTREFVALAGMTPGAYRRVGSVGFIQYGNGPPA